MESHYKKLREEADNMRVNPPVSAWPKIQKRLQKEPVDSNRFKLSARFILSIAASVFLAVFCYNLFVFNVETRSDSLKGNIASWESLDTNADYLYSVEQVRALRHLFPDEADVRVN